MGSSGGGTSQVTSPEQSMIMQMALPTWARAFGGTYTPGSSTGGLGTSTQSFYNQPQSLYGVPSPYDSGLVSTSQGWLDAANPLAGVVGTTFGPNYGESSAEWMGRRNAGYSPNTFTPGTGIGGSNLGVPLPTQGWFSGLVSSF